MGSVGRKKSAQVHNNQDCEGNQSTWGGEREGAGRKYDEEAWREGEITRFVKQQLPGDLAVRALKLLIRGDKDAAIKQLCEVITKAKLEKAIARLEEVTDACNPEMLAAVVDVYNMSSKQKVGRLVHRLMAAAKEIEPGEHEDTPERQRRIRSVGSKASHAKNNPPPREVRAEWMRQNQEELIRLMKEKDPKARVGKATEPIDPDLWPVTMTYWPAQPLRQLCRDPACEYGPREHLHCRECKAVMRFDVPPPVELPRRQDYQGLCENCIRKRFQKPRKKRKG